MAILGDGTVVAITDGGGGAFATIAGVFDLDYPKPVSENVDVTAFDSPAGAPETIPATRPSGVPSFQFQCIYTKARYARLKALERVAGHSLKITLVDTTSITTIPMSITSCTRDKLTVPGRVTFTVMCDVTGVITEA